VYRPFFNQFLIKKAKVRIQCQGQGQSPNRPALKVQILVKAFQVALGLKEGYLASTQGLVG
jgi:hypothetical protein